MSACVRMYYRDKYAKYTYENHIFVQTSKQRNISHLMHALEETKRRFEDHR